MKLERAFLEIIETEDLEGISIVELDECINEMNILSNNIKLSILEQLLK